MPTTVPTTALAGLLTGLSLIVAIGAQNAFVLRQGIRREHVGAVALLCSVADAALILAGVTGIGTIVERAPVVLDVVRWAGAAFLLGYAALALSLSLLVSTSYHLGYAEFRDADLRSPLIGTVVANVPAMTTGNPLGAVVTHSMVHTAAVVHQRDGGSTQMLPPQVDTGYPSRGDSDVAAGLAALWLLVTGGVLALVVRRRRVRPPTPDPSR